MEGEKRSSDFVNLITPLNEAPPELRSDKNISTDYDIVSLVGKISSSSMSYINFILKFDPSNRKKKCQTHRKININKIILKHTQK